MMASSCGLAICGGYIAVYGIAEPILLFLLSSDLQFASWALRTY